MDRNELIEKAKRFWGRPEVPGNWDTLFATMADFALSLGAKDEWPQAGDQCWCLDSDGVVEFTWHNFGVDNDCLVRGSVYRTKAEADLADRQRIARTAIHRWIEEKAEKVDWSNLHIKTFPVLCNGKWEQYCWTEIYIPGWFYAYEKDYDRLMSENAQHFDVLKEGEL